jgi:putative FmdB family regulatory protein
MPLYRFRCDQCGLVFEERQTISEHDNGWPECPRCHSAARVMNRWPQLSQTKA